MIGFRRRVCLVSPLHLRQLVMLRVQHGASAVGRGICFRRPIGQNMSSYEGTSDLASDAMRAAVAKRWGRRAASTADRPYTPPPLLKTWQPTHGIVFNSTPQSSSQRPLSTASNCDIEEDLLAHSTTEDNYVLTGLSKSTKPVADDDTTPKESSEKPLKVEASIANGNKPDALIESQTRLDPAKVKVPKTTFSYKIVNDLFQAARSAPPQSPESYWSHNLYRGPSPPDNLPKVKVHYCQSLHTTERVISQYFLTQKVIGFDIEWSSEANRYSGPKQNVSLIQLACEERVALIHIALFAKDHVSALVAPSLKKLMEDSNITKVGVAIKGDATRLRNNLEIKSRGLFELSHLFKLIKYSESKDYKQINKKLVSLANQVQEHLHLPMFKGVDVRSSDWSKRIGMEQITYAAGDSYAGLQLYNVMDLKRQKLDPVPPLPYHAELDRPIRLAEGVVMVIDPVTEEQEEPEEATEAASSRPITTIRAPKLSKSDLFEESESDSDSDFQPPQDPLNTKAGQPTTTRSTSKPKTKHPLLALAEARASLHRSLLPPSTPSNDQRATAAHIRAYFLFSLNPTLTIPEIAAILRDPPLQTATVAAYILEAVRLDGKTLDGGKWDRVRVRGVLKVWRQNGGGKGWMGKRYRGLERELEGHGEGE